jgi:mRNA interferase MazF
VVISRGGVYWAELGGRLPVLVVQAQAYTESRLPTVVVAILSSNTRLATVPGNVFVPAAASGLPEDAVVTVTVLVTVEKRGLQGPVGTLPLEQMRAVDDGLRRVLEVP